MAGHCRSKREGNRKGWKVIMTEKELMLSEKLYIAKDEELSKDFMRARRLTRRLNESTEEETELRTQTVKELLRRQERMCGWNRRFTVIMAVRYQWEKIFMPTLTALF